MGAFILILYEDDDVEDERLVEVLLDNFVFALLFGVVDAEDDE